MGEVHEGTTTTDWMEEERRRGITITSAAVSCLWKSSRINIIDTPGHVDFTAEVERCLRVLDGAVAVFCGVGGVEPQSETVWRQADKYKLARLAFVNKLDRPGADFFEVVSQISTKLGASPAPVQMPIGAESELRGVIDLVSLKGYEFPPDDRGQGGRGMVEVPLAGETLELAREHRAELVEIVANADDGLADKFLAGEEAGEEEIQAALRRACIAGTVVPVLCGAAYLNIGVQPLLEAVIDYLPSPVDIRMTVGHHPDTEEEVERKHYSDQPFSALAFKTANDPHGNLVFLRVYSGVLHRGDRVLNASKDRKERAGHLLRLHADQRESLELAGPGAACAPRTVRWSSSPRASRTRSSPWPWSPAPAPTASAWPGP